MGSLTAQILVGDAHPYDGGITLRIIYSCLKTLVLPGFWLTRIYLKSPLIFVRVAGQRKPGLSGFRVLKICLKMRC